MISWLFLLICGPLEFVEKDDGSDQPTPALALLSSFTVAERFIVLEMSVRVTEILL